MPKIFGQNITNKSISIPNNKGISPGQPTNYMSILLLQHIHQFAGEWIGMSCSFFSAFVLFGSPSFRLIWLRRMLRLHRSGRSGRAFGRAEGSQRGRMEIRMLGTEMATCVMCVVLVTMGLRRRSDVMKIPRRMRHVQNLLMICDMGIFRNGRGRTSTVMLRSVMNMRQGGWHAQSGHNGGGGSGQNRSRCHRSSRGDCVRRGGMCRRMGIVAILSLGEIFS
mmetsp:Transcript_17890/g.37285  ORF Transcript_17890/g.37285 Transcript_17890/m.37285 type:complete len:222 (-) Transcript_17890:375-1040(-)